MGVAPVTATGKVALFFQFPYPTLLPAGRALGPSDCTYQWWGGYNMGYFPCERIIRTYLIHADRCKLARRSIAFAAKPEPHAMAPKYSVKGRARAPRLLFATP